MKIAVVGAGAIGGVVAWHLARAGLAPVIVGRAETAALFARDGVTVVTPQGAETQAVRAVSDAAAAGPMDVVLVGLKAHDWPLALPLIAPLVGANTVVAPLLNGLPWWYFDGLEGPFAGRQLRCVDPQGVIAAALPVERVIGCVVYMGAWRETPTRSHWNGRKRLVLGEPRGAISERLDALAALLAKAGLEAVATADIRSEIWRKLMGNSSYNPLAVVTDATIAEMAEDPMLAPITRAIMAETLAVARSVGAGQDVDLAERQMVAPQMRGFRTSMHADFEAGRALELGALVDAVVEVGGWTGVATPITETVGRLAAARWRRRHGADRAA